MSDDETVVLILCGIVGVFLWIRWALNLANVDPRSCSSKTRNALGLLPAGAAFMLFLILAGFASHDVRDSPTYLFFYMVMGAAWVGAFMNLLSFFGLSVRDDALERGNQAAVTAIGGALIGATLCFAGGNIGDGPGWWVVVFAALLSTVTFLILWAIFDRCTHAADTITIDRDRAAGLRVAGLFVGLGLILGRAVAGNWVSAEATVSDFVRTGFPALFLLIVAIVIERSLARVRESGGLAGIIYIAGGGLTVWLMGPWK